MSRTNTLSLTTSRAVARRAAGRREREAEIAKNLVRLRLDIVAADEVAVAVERGLPGDEHQPRPADLDHVRIPRRRCQLRGMDGADLAACAVGPCGPPH